MPSGQMRTMEHLSPQAQTVGLFPDPQTTMPVGPPVSAGPQAGGKGGPAPGANTQQAPGGNPYEATRQFNPRFNFGGGQQGVGRDFQGFAGQGGWGSGLQGLTAGPPGMFGIMPGGINAGQAFRNARNFDANSMVYQPGQNNIDALRQLAGAPVTGGTDQGGGGAPGGDPGTPQPGNPAGDIGVVGEVGNGGYTGINNPGQINPGAGVGQNPYWPGYGWDNFHNPVQPPTQGDLWRSFG